jgi:site-specific recombinase XerD
VEPSAAFAQLQLGFIDQIQWRDEVIRPLVLFADRTAQQRAQETETHPDTVRTLQRCFRLGCPVHPHMLRHACGYTLANAGQDTKAIRNYGGHRNIQHTQQDTQLSPQRFARFWTD